MLTKVPFYNGITRKMVVAFGGLFNNLFVVTKDANDSTQKIVKVPLAFANKEKFIVRLQQDPGLQQDTETLLPRMSFEIIGYDYDADRQLNKVNKTLESQAGRTVKMYTPVPWNIQLNLYSFTRTMEDNLQIMEQIIPYFSPDFNLSVKVIKDPETIQNVSLILNDVNTDDQYDGGYEERRYIVTTYSFTLKAFYYGPGIGTIDPENHFESGDPVNVIKKVDVNINGARKYSAVVDPFSAEETDQHTIVDSWNDL